MAFLTAIFNREGHCLTTLVTTHDKYLLPDGTQVGLAVAGATRYPAPTLNLVTNEFTVGDVSFPASPLAGTATVVGTVATPWSRNCLTSANRPSIAGSPGIACAAKTAFESVYSCAQ